MFLLPGRMYPLPVCGTQGNPERESHCFFGSSFREMIRAGKVLNVNVRLFSHPCGFPMYVATPLLRMSLPASPEVPAIRSVSTSSECALPFHPVCPSWGVVFMY